VTVDSSKVAVITGGAMGIGRYIARSFGEAGYKVAIVDIADMEASAKDVRQTEAEVVAIHADLTDEEQVAGAIKKIVDSWDASMS
jgi:3-oxoacyl-[acyl-carrier protein] reductase